MGRLDARGAEENCIAYITSEDGAGGTTFARMLGWEFAGKGYPVLIAKPFPFIPNAVSVANFLSRVRTASDDDTSDKLIKKKRRYETPSIIIFDRIHWEHRGSELRQFRNALEKHGRPACLLVITGPYKEVAYFDASVFKHLADLNHVMDQNDARRLGNHLNTFLRHYGKARADYLWDRFYHDHVIHNLEGVTTFWIALSFWIQRQYDLSESIQEWIYKSFKNINNRTIQNAILEIAAMSSERLPMPDGLLPASDNEWPVSVLLEDNQKSLSSIGLFRVDRSRERKYWALVHDILGRLLINAVFYDVQARKEFGYSTAMNPEYLRFSILRNISRKTELGERQYIEYGEEFATSIFKLDPDHGRAAFMMFWRDVLESLDNMARPLQHGSRVFRHHTAVSRRRIAKSDKGLYDVSIDDRRNLLERAIADIEYALSSVGYTPGSESDLNLYNSLARAYQDLAELEERCGASQSRIVTLLGFASEAIRRAYRERPDNSFVIETYVRDLLTKSKMDADGAVEHSIEALGILFSAMSSDEESYRRAELGKLAERALDILFDQTPQNLHREEPTNAIEVLAKAWVVLAGTRHNEPNIELSDLSKHNQIRALEVLEHPAGRGNDQVIRLSYELVCATHPFDYSRQLENLEQLVASEDYWLTPQKRLEYGILLYQNERPDEGDREFRGLRKRWRETEDFVSVPKSLRWLRKGGERAGEVRQVRATVRSEYGQRSMARVREFRDLEVPFRVEEFDMAVSRPGTMFTGLISFGHNGPFLRPVTARTN